MSTGTGYRIALAAAFAIYAATLIVVFSYL